MNKLIILMTLLGMYKSIEMPETLDNVVGLKIVPLEMRRSFNAYVNNQIILTNSIFCLALMVYLMIIFNNTGDLTVMFLVFGMFIGCNPFIYNNIVTYFNIQSVILSIMIFIMLSRKDTYGIGIILLCIVALLINTASYGIKDLDSFADNQDTFEKLLINPSYFGTIQVCHTKYVGPLLYKDGYNYFNGFTNVYYRDYLIFSGNIYYNNNKWVFQNQMQ